MTYRINNLHRRFYIAVLLSGALYSFTGCNATTAEQNKVLPQTATADNLLLQIDEALHERLQAVLSADDQYAQLLSGVATPASLDEKNGLVIQAEIALQKTIDSLEKVIQKKDAGKDRLTRQVLYFKEALHNRRAVSDMRMAVSADTDETMTAQQQVSALRFQLQEKNKQIAALEQELKTGKPLPAPARTTTAETENATYAPARGESPADLKQRNKNLSLALNNLQTKYFVLGRDYLVLKQQHERAMKELTALRKPGAQE